MSQTRRHGISAGSLALPLPDPNRRESDPEAAVRGELRGLIYDLSDQLLEGGERAALQDAVRHAWLLADLGRVEGGLLRPLLRSLRRDLLNATTDRTYYANQLQNAAAALR